MLLPAHEGKERQVLQVLMTEPSAYIAVCRYISTDCFTSKARRQIWTEMVRRHLACEACEMLDLMQVARQAGDSAMLQEIVEVSTVDGVTVSAMLASNVQELQVYRSKRMAVLFADKLMKMAQDPLTLMSDMRSAYDDAVKIFENGFDLHYKSLAETTKVLDKIVAENREKGQSSGLMTGIEGIDAKGGMSLSDLNTWMGESGHGKTSLALTIARNMAERGDGCVIYSLEMPDIQVTAKIHSLVAKIPARMLLSEPLSDGDYERFKDNIYKVEGLPIYFDDRSTSRLEDIMQSIRRIVVETGVRIVWIDYIQILSINEGGRMTVEERLAEACRLLKNLAKELGVAINILSQVKRDNSRDVPGNDDARGSGQIVEASDNVYIVYSPTQKQRTAFPREYGYSGPVDKLALVKHTKGRLNGIDFFFLHFEKDYGEFTDAHVVINQDSDDTPF